MMDLSDGLGLDLHRFADASGVGFDLSDVPVADGATSEEAISGGEDYELLIATDDAARLRLVFQDRGLREPLSIGRVVADVATRTLRELSSNVGAGSTSSELRLDGATSGLGDLARSDTAGADVHALGRTADDGAHALDIRVPTTLGAAME